MRDFTGFHWGQMVISSGMSIYAAQKNDAFHWFHPPIGGLTRQTSGFDQHTDLHKKKAATFGIYLGVWTKQLVQVSDMKSNGHGIIQHWEIGFTSQTRCHASCVLEFSSHTSDVARKFCEKSWKPIYHYIPEENHLSKLYHDELRWTNHGTYTSSSHLILPPQMPRPSHTA